MLLAIDIGNTNVTDSAWVRLTATYSVALANSSLALYVETASATAPARPEKCPIGATITS